MAETKTISILDEEFTVTTPYAEGHTISAAEAKALNQVRAENISNNFRAKVKAAKEAGNLDEVRAELAKYDAEYIFTLASVGGGRAPVDPVEREAKRIAEQLVTNLIKEQKGITKKEYLAQPDGEKRFAENVAKFMENEQVRAAAKKAVKQREDQKKALASIELA